MIGKTLAHYKVTEKIGAGGMGEVYRAADSKLGRDVALKVLPADFARDPDRVARFRREAQLLAALSHPNIGGIFGLEEFDGSFALVLELVEGPTLADRIGGGRLPLEEALPIAVQIADALEAAHDKGIIHRDLKPANVKLGPEGRVKVLDFGLAKAVLGDAASGSAESSGAPDLSDSPTISPTDARSLTGAHVILGTAAYMSPEQARRKPVDRRADVWAFGAVLFEMLTGTPPFPGETVTDVLAAVVRAEPDWSRLPAETPPDVRRLLVRCLRKDPARRTRHVGDARLELEDALDPSVGGTPDDTTRPSGSHSGRNLLLGAALGAAAVAGLNALGLLDGTDGTPSPAPVRQLTLELPERAPSRVSVFSSGAAVSPDGRHMAFVDTERTLRVRALDSRESTVISGTTGSRQPFFSPDGEWIGFFRGFRLWKVATGGGVPIELGSVRSYMLGACWGADGQIYYSRFAGDDWIPAIYRVPEGGGEGEPVPIEEDESGTWRAMSWPELLPGGQGLLVVASRGGAAEPSPDGTRIEAVSLETGRRTPVLKGTSWPSFQRSGHVLALDDADRLLAVPFSEERLAPTGPPQLVVDEATWPYTVTRDGTLYYTTAHERPGERNRILRISGDGSTESLGVPPAGFLSVELSPDGRRLALCRMDRGSANLWIWDLERRALTALTRGPGLSFEPRWSPDGRTIAFSRGFAEAEEAGLFTVPADGSSPPKRVATGVLVRMGSWTPDGEHLVYGWVNRSAGHEASQLWMVHRSGESDPEQLTDAEYYETRPSVSPDGRRVAYLAFPTGPAEVWMRPFGGDGAPIQISEAGRTADDGERGSIGTDLVWSRDSRTLYYAQGSRMMSVSVGDGDGASPGTPVVVFEREDVGHFTLSADGKSFLMVEESPGETVRNLNVLEGLATRLGRAPPETRP